MSGGRLTSVGPQVIPQLVLTTTGRKSGKERTVQLGYTKDGDDLLVVASNLGGTNHPAWSHNLDANPRAKIQLASEKTEVVAARLTDSEKAILWPKIVGTIPQMKSYVKRTERNIKVYRLALLTVLALVLGVPVAHQFDGSTASAGRNYEFTPYGFCRNN
jgi:deazaflavin-dependent oxidoreductase (nitroreductase family)